MPLTNGSRSGSYSFFAYYFSKVHLHHLSKIIIKFIKKSQKVGINDFLIIFS
jgi:hypothetical protein